jgi:hypothetical protein
MNRRVATHGRICLVGAVVAAATIAVAGMAMSQALASSFTSVVHLASWVSGDGGPCVRFLIGWI